MIAAKVLLGQCFENHDSSHSPELDTLPATALPKNI